MKRACWVLLLVFLFSSTAFAGPLERFFRDRDAGSTIELDDSSVAVIELETNPSTGNGWHALHALGKRVHIVRREFEPAEPGLLGGSGIERIYVVGESVGKSDLTFEYRRSYEKRAQRSLKYRFNILKKFRAKYLSAYRDRVADTIGATASSDNLSGAAATPDNTTLKAPLSGLPTSYNFCDVHGCPPIRDQGQCGGCWAFATQGPLECLIMAEDGVSVDLSEQYLLSCNNEGWGCQGGYWAHEYNINRKVAGEQQAGSPFESIMPYQDRNTACNGPHSKSPYKASDWGYVCGNEWCMPTTQQIKQALYDHGPLSVAVCINYAFQMYSGGVYTGSMFPCYSVNHGVVLVGWDDSTNSWIIRNTWGPNWGENGYMRIGYGVSHIGETAAWVDYAGNGNSSSTTTSTSSTSSTSSSSSSTTTSSSGGCEPYNPFNPFPASSSSSSGCN